MLHRIWKYAASHPMTKGAPAAAVGRYLRFQILTRTRKTATIDWFAGAKLSVSKNMAGVSGNIYCGLHEPADMGLFLHYLRADDLFLDIGANAGTFTVISSKICGAKTIAFEPSPEAAERLRRNVAVNAIGPLVEIAEIAIADHEGEVPFTEGLDAMNHIPTSGGDRMVPCQRLDHYLGGRQPTAMKLDVEGAEAAVFAGAEKTIASTSLEVIEAESWDEPIPTLLAANGFSRAYYDPFSRTLSGTYLPTRMSNALFVRDLGRVQCRVQSAPRRQILRRVTL